MRRKGVQGSITIFLALIMLPMFTCAGLIVDGARISAARTSASGAGDLAMNAALSEYDKTLYENYGLFAVSEDMNSMQNAAQRYYNNTLEGENLLESSDSYTRSFMNSVFSMFEKDTAQFDNLLRAQGTNFTLAAVEGAVIANPPVLERQIIEHMKYRAPVNLITGLLTKLGCIGESAKQTKVLEAKVDYDKKLNTVQEACQKAYNAINAFQDALKQSKYKNENYSSEIVEDIKEAKGIVVGISEYVLAGDIEKSAAIDSKDTTITTQIETEIATLVGDNKEKETLDKIIIFLKGKDVSLQKDSKGNVSFKPTSFIKGMDQLEKGNTLESNLAYLKEMKALPLREVFTLTERYEFYFAKMKKEDQTKLLNEKNACKDLNEKIKAIATTAANMQQMWKDTANSMGLVIRAELFEKWYAPLEELIGQLDTADKALSAVQEKAQSLDSARNNWGGRIGALSDNEVKGAMQGDYNYAAKDINEAEITALQNMIQENKKHFSGIKEQLDATNCYKKKLCAQEYLTYDYVAGEIDGSGNQTYSQIATQAQALVEKSFQSGNFQLIEPKTYTIVDDKQAFYKYLKKLCQAKPSNADAEVQKKKRNELVKKGNEASSREVTPNSEALLKSLDVNTDILSAIQALGSGEQGKKATVPDGLPEGDDNNAAAEKSQKNLAGMAGFLESLGKVAEAGRDKLYLEEYMTEMFSCYTDTIAAPEKERMSLNGKSFQKNALYGSEAEYLIWGGSTPQENLNNTKGVIFGIRFALNSIFAFTNSTTRTPALMMATAIAGWTGFGVPLVQTVILLGWSMAEAAVDVEDLCKGKDIPIYKTEKTWRTSVASQVADFAKNAVSDVLGEIQALATDKIDQAVNKVGTYAGEVVEGVISSVTATVTTGVEQLLMQAIGSKDPLSHTELENRVEQFIVSMEQQAGEGITGQLQQAAGVAARTYKTELLQQIESIVQKTGGEDLANIEELMMGLNNKIVGIVGKKLQEVMKPYTKKLADQAKTVVQEGTDLAKEKLYKLIDDFTTDLCGPKQSKLAAGTALTMNYREYIKAMILIQLLLGEETENKLLSRTATLIQGNVQNESVGFNGAQAATMLRVDAEVLVPSTFMAVPVSAGVDAQGNTSYVLDFSQFGTGEMKIKYTGILGY